MTTLADTLRPDISGLCHLVEAATALTALVDSSCIVMAKPAIVSDDDESRMKKSESKDSKKRDIFPQKLLEILSESSLSDIVSWLPHGRSFVIIRPDIFTQQVLPKYLPPVDARASTKYPSFTRKLNRWGFRQATRGPDTGAFHHPLFRRDKPELCLEMICQKSRERQSIRRASSEETEGHDDAKTPSGLQIQSTNPESCHTSSLTTDQRSMCSNTNSATSNIQCGNKSSMHGPISIVSGDIPKEYSCHLPFISNDVRFVARTLRERNRNEVLNAAKAMLYDAYLKAARADR